MEQYEVETKINGLRNYVVPVRGSTVTAHLGRWDKTPHLWVYSLWTEPTWDPETQDTYETLIATGDLDMSAGGTEDPMHITPEQVARVAFLLEVEYGNG